MPEMHVIYYSLLGAVFQEVLYWYNIRTKLSGQGHEDILKSKSYWTITSLVIILTPLIVYALKDVLVDAKYQNALLLGLGAGAPLIFKQLVGFAKNLTNRINPIDPAVNPIDPAVNPIDPVAFRNIDSEQKPPAPILSYFP